MPITDPVNWEGKLSFIYPAWSVRLSTDSDPPSTEEEITTDMKPVRVVNTAGGQQMDFADIEWIVSEPLVDRTQPAGFNRMIDVLLPDAPVYRRMLLGDYGSERESVTNSGEELTATAELRPYLFGEPAQGQWWWDKYGDAETLVTTDLVFNPMVDGAVLPNRSSREWRDQTNVFLWLPPEKLTDAAATWHGHSAELWTYQSAIATLLIILNGDETFLENPPATDLVLLTDAPDMRDVKLEHGRYLPFYLDRLLQPIGFNWYVDHQREYEETGNDPGWDNPNKLKPRIRIFRVGYGDEKKLYFQAPGEVLNLDESNVNQYNINRRVSDSVNEVHIVGDIERVEGTFELYPGWAEEFDSIPLDDLRVSNENGVYNDHREVHRMFVGNEGADYSGLRERVHPIGDPPDLRQFFASVIQAPHRRPLDVPLTYLNDHSKERAEVLLEYTLNWLTEAPVWREVPPDWGTWSVLPDQIGVIFSGDTPPKELFHAGKRGKLRVTGTISGDSPLEGVALRQPEAVLGRDNAIYIQAKDKYRYWHVKNDGPWASSLAGSRNGAEEYDDRQDVVDYAEALRTLSHTSEADGSFTLPGIHTYYKIGDLLTEIEGRDISLDQSSTLDTQRKYVQIVRIEYRYVDTGGPVTVIGVDRGTRYINDSRSRRRSRGRRGMG